jgi:DNA-binding CsgD family transcriptional regulator
MRGTGPITQREKEVLHLLAEFKTYEDISSILSIRMCTVYAHIYSIMLKTRHNKKELLIKYAQDHGYGRKSIPA